jgi:hypothetical protein
MNYNWMVLVTSIPLLIYSDQMIYTILTKNGEGPLMDYRFRWVKLTLLSTYL